MDLVWGQGLGQALGQTQFYDLEFGHGFGHGQDQNFELGHEQTSNLGQDFVLGHACPLNSVIYNY